MFRTRTSSQDSSSSGRSQPPMGSIQHSPWIAASEGRHSPLATNVPQVAQPQQEDPKKEKRKTFLGFAMKDKSNSKISASRSANDISTLSRGSQPRPPYNGQRAVSMAPTPSGTFTPDTQRSVPSGSLDPRQRPASMFAKPLPPAKDSPPLHGFMQSSQSPPSTGHSAESLGSGDTAGTSSTMTRPNMPASRPSIDQRSSHDLSVTDSRQSMTQNQGSMPPAVPGMKVNPALVQVFRPLMELIAIQSNKLYGASPPEVEMIFARAANGGQPKQGPPGSPRNDWDGAWLQLTGTSLSVWSMKETAEADKRGERVPPTYFNVTDSSLELLAPLPPPPHRADSHPHPFVFSLNTAGSNRILFSCSSEANLSFWVTAFRLAAWEKSRIEEIYTGHALRTFIKASPAQPAPVAFGEKVSWNEPKSPLQKGKMEGWVKVRVMGGTDWKRLYLVLSSAGAGDNKQDTPEKKRKSMFSFGTHDTKVSEPGPASTAPKQPTQMTSIASAVFYQTPPVKSKSTKGATPSAPMLTVTHISQAFAVFPEHLEVVNSSNLFKVIGHISGEMVVVEGRQRLSGWIMIMPERLEVDTHSPEDVSPLVLDMLRWCVGIHDAFGLYGRPERYNWNPRDPTSLFFGYPEVASSERLFLDASVERVIDYRHDVIAGIRQAYSNLYVHRREAPSQPSGSPGRVELSRESPRSSPRGTQSGAQSDGQTVTLPPVQSPGSEQELATPNFNNLGNIRLPPLTFESGLIDHPTRSDALTPILEVASRKTSNSTLRTNEPQKSMGSHSSARERLQYSGSGSSGPKSGGIIGTKLEDALVAETLTTSPLPEEERDGMKSEATPRPEQFRQVQDGQTPTSESNGAGLSHQSSISSYSQYSLPPLPQAVYGIPVIEGSQTEETLQPQNGIPASPAPAAEVQPLLGKPLLADTPPNGITGPASRANELREIIAPTPQRAQQLSPESNHVLHDEAEAIYLWHENQEKNSDAGATQPPVDIPGSSGPADQRARPRIITDFASPQPTDVLAMPPSVAGAAERQSRSPLGRKPSGARAMPTKRQASTSSSIPSVTSSSKFLPEDVEEEREITPDAGGGNNLPSPPDSNRPLPVSASLDRDAMAAMSFLNNVDSPKEPTPAPLTQPSSKSGSPPPQQKSSFAFSKTAAQRRARAEEAERQRDAAYRAPGAGRKGKKLAKDSSNWSASSDEEDDEAEDEDHDDRDEGHGGNGPHSNRQVQAPGNEDGSDRNLDGQAILGRGQPPRPLPDPDLPQRRASRNLPPIPGQNPGARAVTVVGTEHLAPQRQWQESGSGNRASSYSVQPVQQRDRLVEAPLPSMRPPARNSVWISNLDAQHTGIDPNQNNNGKFVSIEPSAQLTKAFVPHGLLQAGLQDKEDRSARKQEEVARETGSSLVNVPNKPPPPQTGLLGAITAHERDRKGAGGIGAALTERERDRRLAEERQRQIDDLETLQRQQTMSQSGGDYTRPMSTVGYGAMMPPMQYPGSAMMWPNTFNPYAQQQQQQMFQQQAMMAAQQAYQQSLYAAMSIAGSQAGDVDGRVGSPMAGSAGYPASMNMGYGGMPPFMPPYGMMGGSPMMTPFMGSFPPGSAYPPGSAAEMPQSRMSSYNLGPDRGPMPEQRTASPLRQGDQGRASPRDRVT